MLRRVLALVAVLLGAIVSGCGGGGDGGDGVLTVSVSYAGEAYLFRSSTIAPVMSGFEGHSPHCSLGSGRLPTGMSLNSDCSISGSPAEVGLFQFVVHIGAAGVSNQLDWNVGFAVFGPSVLYLDDYQRFSVGQVVDLQPMNVFWRPVAGETLTYSLASGSLPTGVAIDAATGRIHGTPTSIGDYSYTVRADVISAGQTGFALQQTPMHMTSSLAGAAGYVNGILGWLTEPLDISPSLPATPGATFDVAFTPGTLPAGLTLEASTGRIRGTPSIESREHYSVAITQFYAGQTSATLIPTPVAMNSPVYILYVGFCRVNIACSEGPTIFVNAPFSFSDATYAYTVSPTSVLPAGLSLDPATGVVSGTAIVQNSRITIDISVTRSGVTFMVPVWFSVAS